MTLRQCLDYDISVISLNYDSGKGNKIGGKGESKRHQDSIFSLISFEFLMTHLARNKINLINLEFPSRMIIASSPSSCIKPGKQNCEKIPLRSKPHVSPHPNHDVVLINYFLYLLIFIERIITSRSLNKTG